MNGVENVVNKELNNSTTLDFVHSYRKGTRK